MKLEIPSRAQVGLVANCHLAAFTLIEASVASGLIGILLVSLYAGFSMGFGAVEIARENERATQILVQKMEGIRLCNWTQVNTAGFIPTNFAEPFDPADINRVGLVMNGSITIANTGTGTAYSNALKVVSINLSWTSANTLHQRQIQTLAAQYGMQNYIY